MKFIIIGKNIEVTPGLKAAVEDKIGKLEKYFNPDTEVHVTLSVEKDRQKIEVTIPVKGSIIRSEQVSNDMYVSIDLVEEIIERQLKKYKNKIVDKQQAASSFSKMYMENDYTDDGQLLGHIVMGAQMVGEKAAGIEGFPHGLLSELQHCILAHHGKYEYGSPKVPALIEAMALNYADDTDAKMETFKEILENNSDNNGWFGYNRLMESNLRSTRG